MGGSRLLCLRQWHVPQDPLTESISIHVNAPWSQHCYRKVSRAHTLGIWLPCLFFLFDTEPAHRLGYKSPIFKWGHFHHGAFHWVKTENQSPFLWPNIPVALKAWVSSCLITTGVEGIQRRHPSHCLVSEQNCDNSISDGRVCFYSQKYAVRRLKFSLVLDTRTEQPLCPKVHPFTKLHSSLLRLKV